MNVLLLVFVLLSWFWPFGHSGKTYHLIPSSVVPAATGTVKVQREKDNENTKLDIKVEHLAPPSKLTPPQNVYLVWARPRGGEPVKLGALGVGNDLKGELNAVTVLKVFDLSITGEQNESVSVPSGVQVFHTFINAG